MLKKILTVATSLILSTTAVFAACGTCKTKEHHNLILTNPILKSTLSIIPRPQKMLKLNGQFTISTTTKIKIAKKLWSGAKALIPILKNSGVIPATKVGETSDEKNTIIFRYDSAIKNKEAYTLEVTDHKVLIKAAAPNGAFYAVQTLRQMLPAAIEGKDGVKVADKLILQAVTIKDEPRFEYRGFMLDSCRHYTELRDIKKMLDMLALYKLNKFHWHLTDDQGWRLEIKKYPLLTQKGAFRKNTLLSNHNTSIGTPQEKWTNKPYGNFYSQDQARDIVKYAAERFITVIPEIEMPGHSVAAVHAYPWLSCEGTPKEVWGRWGISDDIYCAGKETTFKFLEDVLTETMAIFPSSIIHIGGDEAKKTKWKNCKLCQKRIKDEGLKNENELQSYFIKRINKFVKSKGREIIGWDEILEGGLAEGAMVMSWRGTKGGIKAAQMGHYVVMTPGTHCYFDHYQSRKKSNEPLAIGGCTPVKKVYQFNPTYGMDKKSAKFVKGGQANLWHEYIRDNDYRQYMTFPRLLALSECVWTPVKEKDYKNFLTRLENHYHRLDELKVIYRRHDKK